VNFLDLDGFKEINDQHGHGEGDRVLQDIAHRIKDRTPAGTLVSRFGGDEFCVLLRGARLEQAEHISKAIMRGVQEPLFFGRHTYRLTISVGIVVSGGHQASDCDPIRDADLAMYAAKQSGRDRVVVFHPSMRPSKVAGATQLRSATY
jgi:diguanylate cyclase (GGDEF)-like protein